RIVDRDHIVVGRKEDSAAEMLDAVPRFLLERSLYFLRYDAAAEDTCECVTDSSLQLSLKTLNDAHRGLLSLRNDEWKNARQLAPASPTRVSFELLSGSTVLSNGCSAVPGSGSCMISVPHTEVPCVL